MFETKDSQVEQTDAGRMSLREAPRSQCGDAGDSSNKGGDLSVDLSSASFPERQDSLKVQEAESKMDARSNGGDSSDKGGGDHNVDLNTSVTEKQDSALHEIRSGARQEIMNKADTAKSDRSQELQAASSKPANDMLAEE